MDDIRACSVEKGPSFRPPLITPSASPPVSRVWSRRDKPAPAKRPRLSSTPSSSSSAQPPFSSSSVADLRLESSSRLFQFWDQLAGRYNKPLDEDDIVDFRNFKIIRDRGVVSSAASPYKIGSLLAPEADPEHVTQDEGAGAAEEEGDGEEEEDGDDDSGDELDLISPPPSVPVKLEYYKTWYVPPADEKDPEDAEAFREFEEAEKKRRELYGDVDEGEEEEGVLIGLEEGEDPGVQLHEADDEEAEANPGQDEHERPPSPRPKRMPPRPKSRPLDRTGDESSEDELAAAEIDNTPPPPRQSMPPVDDIIDLTDSPSPIRVSRGRPPSQPPRMQIAASSRGRSQSKRPVLAAKCATTPEQSSSPQQVLQLLTPPRSSSAIGSTPDTQREHSPASRAETPSPKFPKTRLRYTPRPRSPSEDDENEDGELPSLDLGERTAARDPFPVGPPRWAKKKRLPPMPEVVITTLSKELNGQPGSARLASTESVSSPSLTAVKRKSVRGKGKGKGREIAASKSSSPSSTSRVSRPRCSQSQPRGSTREPTEEFSSPQPRPPPRGTKRRRVSSLSSLSGDSPAKPVTPEPLPTTSRSVRKHHDTRSSDWSDYSSDIAPPTSSSVRADDEDGMSRRLSDRMRVLRRNAQKRSFLSSSAATTLAQEVLLLYRRHKSPHYTRPRFLSIPHDIVPTIRRQAAIATIQNVTNGIRRFLSCQTLRRNTIWPRRCTVSRISWLRAHSTLRCLRHLLLAIPLAFPSHLPHGRPTLPAIAATTPSRPTSWTHRRPKQALLGLRHILLPRAIRTHTRTRMTPDSLTTRFHLLHRSHPPHPPRRLPFALHP